MKSIPKNILTLGALVFTLVLSAQNITQLNTDDQKASYIIGMQIGDAFKTQGLDKDIDLNILKQAIQDKFDKKPALFPEDSIQSFMVTYEKKLTEKMIKINGEESKKFLEENKKKQGVKVTSSGLQYKVVKQGTGAKPTDTDEVTVHYVLKKTDGTVIQDTKKLNNNQPVALGLSGVVLGWSEGLKLMSKGAKYTLYLPASIAYGENEGPAGPNQALIFEVELIDFGPAPEKEPYEDYTEE